LTLIVANAVHNGFLRDQYAICRTISRLSVPSRVTHFYTPRPTNRATERPSEKGFGDGALIKLVAHDNGDDEDGWMGNGQRFPLL